MIVVANCEGDGVVAEQLVGDLVMETNTTVGIIDTAMSLDGRLENSIKCHELVLSNSDPDISDFGRFSASVTKYPLDLTMPRRSRSVRF